MKNKISILCVYDNNFSNYPNDQKDKCRSLKCVCTLYYVLLHIGYIGIYIESLLKNSIVLLLKEDGEW